MTETFCAGSLISSIYVLTAAHCVDGQTKFHIRAGTNSSHSGGEIVGVAQVIHYPYRSLIYDIALLRLERPIYGENIKPIALPSMGEPVAENVFVNVAGWGKMDEIEVIFPENLQEVDIPIVNHEECATIYRNMVLRKNVTDNMICAGIMGQGGKAPCIGDSGGPAVYNKKLIGIVSWGFKCASGEYPAVFTKVSGFVNWIYKTI